MWRCQALGVAHFIFGIVFAVGAMLVTPESASPWVLLIHAPDAQRQAHRRRRVKNLPRPGEGKID